ncbi:MAG: hypothetical protein B0D92_00390 [Spirochaeta sp. LUC14_002_19_P3]|nr:MAG: hypothetical protein B0D92_00390 [Spirochaeta sp. LUC14_002_19_P3]
MSSWLKTVITGTRVFALVGKSGTGKSFRAKLIAERYGIDYIIDDGLMIHKNRIVAGKSAKHEAVYMSAVKTALFDDNLHRHEVIKAIQSRRIKKLLILGTSERMVNRTAELLQLPPPTKIIFIEEVSSAADIEKAQYSRNVEGKHVIPVPTMEVERDYPQLFSKSIKVLFKMSRGFGLLKKPSHKVYEKSVVHPSFHNREAGKIAISEQALGQMVAHCVDEFDNSALVQKVKIRPQNGVYRIRAEVALSYGSQLGSNIHELHNYIINRIEKFTGITIKECDIVITQVSKRNKILSPETSETLEFE